MARFSNRLTSFGAPENAFTRLTQELKASGKPLLDLTGSNPTEALVDYPHSSIANALSAVNNFTYQPEAFGNFKVRAAIAAQMQGVSPTNVALTASTSEAYAVLFKLLADPGDEILVPTPSYPLFDYLAQLDTVKLRPYRLGYDGSWYIDFASLETAVTPRTRALILVNPNNPTGSFLKASEYSRLIDFSLAHNLALISDEVFQNYALSGSGDRVTTLAGRHEVLAFTLNGLSKGAGMPQMKLGWMAVNGPAQQREQACTRLELILDTYLSVGAPVQLAADGLLRIGGQIQAKIHARIRRNLIRLDELLVNQDVHRLHAEGGWSVILRVPRIVSEEEWIRRLLTEHQVVVQPGYFFDMPGEAYLVVSLLTPDRNFEIGIEQILAFTEKLTTV